MIESVLSRIIQGALSGIGMGFLFYCYPFVRHLISRDSRFRFYQAQHTNIDFKKECIKYLKIGLTYGFIYGLIMGTIIGPFGQRNGL